MSYELTSLDLHHLVDELQVLRGARVDKVFSPTKKELLLQLFLTGEGRKILRINAPSHIYFSTFKEDQPERPSGFCALLRKYLDNARLREITQLGFERIIELVFEGKEGTYRIFAELFSKGNIVLCKEDNTIIMPAESQDWKGRSIRPKLEYAVPKREWDFLTLSEKDLKQAAASSNKGIVKLLAAEMGLGGRYAEELCALAGVPKDKTMLDEEDTKRIILVRERFLSKTQSPSIYFEEGEVKAISPFGLATLEGREAKSFKSYNEALDYVFSQNLLKSTNSKKLSTHQARIDRLMKIIKSQEEYLAGLEKEVLEESSKGEAIYSNYQMITEILRELNKARAKYPLREIREKLKGHRIIKDIKEKEKAAVFEL